MTRRVYRSTDYGASALSGQTGALITILDAVLVNGYGQQTIASGQLTSSGTTVTCNLPVAHGLVGTAKMTIAGANETAYNGEFSVIPTTATTFTYTALSTPSASPATGATVTAKMTGAGWTKEYSGTNIAAYKQGAGSNGFYIRVDDTGAQAARVVGYEAMTGISTGTGDFPTASQFSGGLYLYKSSVADATTRPWLITASEKSVRIFVDTTNAGTNGHLTFFGDLTNYGTDAYATMLIAHPSATITGPTMQNLGTNLSSAITGHYLARTYLGTGTSVTALKHSDNVKGTTTVGNGIMAYPSPVDGALYMSPIFVSESVTSALRGEIPGLWNPLHNRPFAHLDVFDGSGSFAGKKFQAYTHYNNCQYIVEISDTQ